VIFLKSRYYDFSQVAYMIAEGDETARDIVGAGKPMKSFFGD
jgi:hypothetical protein